MLAWGGLLLSKTDVEGLLFLPPLAHEEKGGAEWRGPGRSRWQLTVRSMDNNNARCTDMYVSLSRPTQQRSPPTAALVGCPPPQVPLLSSKSAANQEEATEISDLTVARKIMQKPSAPSGTAMQK